MDLNVVELGFDNVAGMRQFQVMVVYSIPPNLNEAQAMGEIEFRSGNVSMAVLNAHAPLPPPPPGVDDIDLDNLEIVMDFENIGDLPFFNNMVGQLGPGTPDRMD